MSEIFRAVMPPDGEDLIFIVGFAGTIWRSVANAGVREDCRRDSWNLMR